tara:strand:+ start:338 stop:841 length:504 start_codon:yes stop_codon:yes gene_type:complete
MKKRPIEVFIDKIVTKFFDWQSKWSFDTPISNFFKGLVLFGVFIIFIYIALFLVAIPATILYLVLFKGSETVYNLFPEELLKNEFFSMEAGLISFLLVFYLIFILFAICIVVWDIFIKKTNKYKMSLEEMAKGFFESIYFFAKIFVTINLMFLAFAVLVGFLWGLFH